MNWQAFWNSYRKREVAGEQDLFVEVGKTVAQEPISMAAFESSIELVSRDLDLNSHDTLLELCCGNGLMTLPLAALVREVCAVDFTQHLVANARKFRSAPNVSYVCAEAESYIAELASNKSFIPSKILLGDALSYFEPDSFTSILASASKLTAHHFIFLATGIPCDDLKWNFYNTSERVQRYEENQFKPDNTNDGIGRWWKKEELETVARQLALEVAVKEQPSSLSNFRVDAVFHPNE